MCCFCFVVTSRSIWVRTFSYTSDSIMILDNNFFQTKGERKLLKHSVFQKRQEFFEHLKLLASLRFVASVILIFKESCHKLNKIFSFNSLKMTSNSIATLVSSA